MGLDASEGLDAASSEEEEPAAKKSGRPARQLQPTLMLPAACGLKLQHGYVRKTVRLIASSTEPKGLWHIDT